MAYVKKEILFNKDGYQGILKMRKVRDDGGLFQIFLRIDKFVRWMWGAERQLIELACPSMVQSVVVGPGFRCMIEKPVSAVQYNWTNSIVGQKGRIDY